MEYSWENGPYWWGNGDDGFDYWGGYFSYAASTGQDLGNSTDDTFLNYNFWLNEIQVYDNYEHTSIPTTWDSFDFNHAGVNVEDGPRRDVTGFSQETFSLSFARNEFSIGNPATGAATIIGNDETAYMNAERTFLTTELGVYVSNGSTTEYIEPTGANNALQITYLDGNINVRQVAVVSH